MLDDNIAEFRRCNALEYHAAGIMGAGYTAAVLDDGCRPGAYMPYVETPLGVIANGNHASQVCRVVHEWAPLARVVSLPYTGGTWAQKTASIDWILTNRPDMVVCSFHEAAGSQVTRLQAAGIPLFCASGNQDYADRINFPARYDWTIAVGALEEYRDLLARYSNEGPGLDCIAYTDVAIPKSDGEPMYFNGTSCAAPSAAGLFILYSEAMGMRFNAADAILAVQRSCIDYYEPGLDWRSGWGLFVLPRLEAPTMKDINLLHPDLQPKARQLIELAKSKGIEIIVTQTLRTQAEQDALYAQGRTAPGQIVTNLKYPASLHCWGVAFDIACIVNGKAAWGPALYDLVGPLGESLGLTWGGRWANFVDRPHYQLKGYDAAALRLKYLTPERFMATWAKEVEDVAGFEGAARVTYKGKEIPAGILNSETYAKVRPLAELFGKKIVWIPETKTVDIQDV